MRESGVLLTLPGPTWRMRVGGTLKTMRISWLSNAPWARTGYGNQTLLFAPRLQKLGHEVQISAFYGMEGGILNWNGMPVYPRGYHPYGQDVMSAHAAHFRADVLISLIDAWVFEPGMLLGGTRWAAWFPVDHEPVPPPVLQKVQKAWSRIVYSRFAERMIKDTGLDCYYVPHGVDTNKFKPIDRTEARGTMQWPDDKFIVGMVAANKGTPSRKAFCQNIAAFAELKKKHPDVMLYLHTVSGEENAGMNLPVYIESLGLSIGFVGRCDARAVDVLFPDQYQQLIGINDDYMNAAYNAMDVHLLASMGEGFGIPVVEAQAAGCPVIVGDWTSMGELCFSGWKIGKADAEPYWTPLASYQFLPHTGAITERLMTAYSKAGNQYYRDQARKGALAYDADLVAETYWRPVLDDMWERIKAWQPEEKSATENQWIQVGLKNPDGTMDIPCKVTGDALRVWPDGKQQIIKGGFKNPLDLKLVDPDGLEWLLMREVERDYNTADLKLNKDSVVVDIGAHVGIVSMSIAKQFGCRVWAYEPEPENFRRLRANIEANGLGDLVIPFNLAVTKHGTSVIISPDKANSGGATIYGNEQGTLVESTTLGKILKEVGEVDLLKIDCEGSEFEILSKKVGDFQYVGLDGPLASIKAIRGEFHGPHGAALLAAVKEFVPDTRVTLQGVVG